MNSSFNGNDLISYPNQPFCFRPFSFESNPSSKLQQSNSNSNYTLPPPPSPLSFFQFDNHENNNIFLHHDLLLHHHQSVPDVTDLPPVVPPSIPLPMDQQILPRKRSSKRDRHSKINTARGLRDRRMRLSLEVAKRFFGLQDMLGFDKASKTVEWLLNQAKVEIKQIARAKSGVVGGGGGGAKSASSTSECEGVSSLDEVVVSRINQEKEREQPHVRRRTSKVSRKSALNPIGKESREKARERARERTIQKNRTRRLATTESNLNRLSCWNPFDTVEDSGGAAQSQSVNHPSLPEAHEEPNSHANKEHLGTVEEDMAHQDNSFVIMSKWSPTTIFNSLSNSSILQEHQFAEFQSLGKPWEACENHIY